MKVEGAVTPIAATSKIRVKEEAKECCGFQRGTSSCRSPPSSSAATAAAAAAAAAATGIATSCSAISSATASGSGPDVLTAVNAVTIDTSGETTTGSIAVVVAASAVSPSGASPSSASVSPAPSAGSVASVGAAALPPSSGTSAAGTTAAAAAVGSQSPPGVICQAAAPTSRSAMVNKSSESFPVDLDLKTKVPQVLPNGPSPTRERPTRDRGGPIDETVVTEAQQTASRIESRLSPGAIGKTKSHHLVNGVAHSQPDYVRGASGQYAASSGTESPLSSHSIKPENEDSPSSRHQQQQQQLQQDESQSNETGATPSNGGASGARCISGIFAGHGKLKRLLGTLVQFATNISQDTGDSVRSLVLALLSGAMTAEEFHSALQEATNFPLRGFVLPYLRHTLPSLRRDLTAAARTNNQTCVQYLRQNESAVLETVSLAPSSEAVELFSDHGGGGGDRNGIAATNLAHPCSTNYGIMRSSSGAGVGGAVQHASGNSGASQSLHQHYSSGSSGGAPTNLATKRRASDTSYYENGGPLDDGPIYGKRSTNPWSHHNHQQQQQQPQQQPPDPYCWYHPLHSSGGSIQSHTQGHPHAPSPVPPGLVQVNQLTSFGPPHLPHQQQQPQQQQQQQQQQQLGHAAGSLQNSSSLDDEWKNIHVMLNCILGMVEKTKRALAILQRRGSPSPAAALPPLTPGSGTQNGSSNGNSASSNGSHVESSTGDRDTGNLKRLSGEIVAQTIRATEDRVAEVKRRAEEAVQEVKRAAVAEVQRAVAVAVAESRANERLRVHRLLDLPLPHRSHGALRQQSSFIRVAAHINPASTEAAARTAGATLAASLSASAGSTEDEKDVSHMTNVIGSGCWNCGRTALETCGGCGVARYCGSFCQHRDWEAGGHHATCSRPSRDRPRRSSSRSPPRSGTVVVNPNDNDSNGATTATAAK